VTTYRVADGHDVALGSLAVISPQPRSEGVRVTRRSYAADGTPVDEGRYVELEWSALEGVTEYNAILAAFGLDDALSNEVTVYVRDERRAWARLNGRALLPEAGREMRWRYFPRDVVITVRDLEAAS
jgi:hypothetical protein